MAALVYDWCHPLFDASTGAAARDAIAEAIEAVLPSGSIDVGLVRAAILAAIALAGDWGGSEQALAGLLGTHWNADVRPALETGQLTDDGASLIAVLEASLAVRHNLETDLLRPATEALAALVRTRLLSYYPVDIETSEGLARRPSRFGTDDGQAAIQAPLYRIAELLLVAYESNLREFQFIQGWVRDDHYLLRSPMAAPYEFLWGNPYLPGLTPQSAPTLAHDALRGRLYGRMDWQRPTTWIGYADERLKLLAGDSASASDSLQGLSPMYFPDAVVVPVQPPGQVRPLLAACRNAASRGRADLLDRPPGRGDVRPEGGRPTGPPRAGGSRRHPGAAQRPEHPQAGPHRSAEEGSVRTASHAQAHGPAEAASDTRTLAGQVVRVPSRQTGTRS